MSKRPYTNYQARTNWEMVISLVLIMLTTLGTTIPLYLQSSHQIEAIHQEMKDFHGKLCAIEERNKK
jgi:hypothetical protein